MTEPKGVAVPPPAPEAIAQLAAVPDTIGEAPAVLAPGSDEHLGADDVRALLEMVDFEEADVKDLLAEMFDTLADRFGSDHWKLTERQMRLLGGPVTRLVNSVWAKLKLRLPDVIAKWCESTPGAAATILALGIVVVPKVTRQAAITRGRAVPDRAEPKDGKKTAQPLPSEGGIPVATEKLN